MWLWENDLWVFASVLVLYKCGWNYDTNWPPHVLINGESQFRIGLQSKIWVKIRTHELSAYPSLNAGFFRVDTILENAFS